jgi:phosphohistidine phosphatase
MRLFFLRHGDAGDRDAWTGPDEQRPLTQDGGEEMREAARGMQRLKLRVDVVLSSPLVRAEQTASIATEALGRPVITDPALAPGCTLEQLAQVLAEHAGVPAASGYGALLVGHEPDFSAAIAALIGPSGDASITLKKGALCCVDLDTRADAFSWSADRLRGAGTLVWLMTAKQLARVGR